MRVKRRRMQARLRWLAHLCALPPPILPSFARFLPPQGGKEELQAIAEANPILYDAPRFLSSFVSSFAALLRFFALLAAPSLPLTTYRTATGCPARLAKVRSITGASRVASHSREASVR